MNELSTFKGRYEPGEPIKLHLIHQTPADHLKWSLFHLEKELQQGRRIWGGNHPVYKGAFFGMSANGGKRGWKRGTLWLSQRLFAGR